MIAKGQHDSGDILVFNLIAINDAEKLNLSSLLSMLSMTLHSFI